MKQALRVFTLPLALLAATGSGAQTFDLRGPAPAQATLLQSRTDWRMPEGTLTVEAGGETHRLPMARQILSVSEVEILQTDSGKEITMLRYRLAEGWTKTTVHPEGQSAEETTVDDPIVGETILIERRADGWVKTMLGREPDEKQKAWLREPWNEGRERFPTRPVAVGEGWTIEGSKLAALLGFGNALSADGKATFTLERVIEEEGERRAIVAYRLELTGKLLDENNSPAELRLGGSGTLKRSLRSYLDLSDHFTGQSHFAGSLAAEGRTMGITIAGAVTIESSERSITEAARAEVVRRGSTPGIPEKTGSGPSAQAPRPTEAESPGTPPAPSRPAPRTCQGVARPCAQRDDLSCALGFGCSGTGACAGTGFGSCFGKPQFTCSSTPGCFWQAWSKSCGGTPTCFGLPLFTCKTTPGCSWRSQCLGNATPCSRLDASQCSWQPGCSLQ